MDFDLSTQRFQQWLGCFDDYRVRAELEAIELQLQNLQTYRDLLNHALDLKHRSDAWFSSDAWQSWVCADDAKSIAAPSVKGAQNPEGAASASHGAGARTDKPPFAPNSLAERLARERLEPQRRIRAGNAAHPLRAPEHSAQPAETVEPTQHSDPDDERLTTDLPVRVWLDHLEQRNCSDESPDVPSEVPGLELAGLPGDGERATRVEERIEAGPREPDAEGATRVEECIEADPREPHSGVSGAPRGKLGRLNRIPHRLLRST
jgi:hypothetical protein